MCKWETKSIFPTCNEIFYTYNRGKVKELSTLNICEDRYEIWMRIKLSNFNDCNEEISQWMCKEPNVGAFCAEVLRPPCRLTG